MSVWTSKGYCVDYNPTDAKELTIYSELKSDFPGPKPKNVCYKTSGDKIYIPYYYGEKKYGPPSKKFKRVIHNFELEFKGDMRDYQKEVIDKTLHHFSCTTKGGIWSIGTGMGKCLGYNTPIVMFDKNLKMVQNVDIGDILMGDDGTPRVVSSLSRGIEELFEIIPRDCSKGYTVNKSHILTLMDENGNIVDIPLKGYIRDKYKGVRVSSDLLGTPDPTRVTDEVIYDKNYIHNMYAKGYNITYTDEVCIDKSDIKKIRTFEFDIVSKGNGVYYGFTIDGNRRFIINNCIVTHNTVMALNLVQRLGLKTIIVVHKQVLLEQWKERISQFIPKARIGVIQGPTLDIEDKDIIMGMVQTLTQRTYPVGTFNDIGVLICDEVHAMCSKTFSEVLFKIQTPYRLGLSATPKRKDGFDKVLTHHLGPTIIDIHKTLIEPYVYLYNMPEIDIEIKYNKLGKINLPLLITDLADNDDRNSEIINILLEKVIENRKILVFSDRVAQCERLDDFFKLNASSRGISKTSDTFIGKKSKELLANAMKCDIIFATYGIFKEGIDCPELDTLLFATPKTDIVQAVGRILRQENECYPHVIDLVDNIGPLKSQYYARKRWYVSKGYKIHNSEGKVVNTQVFKKCVIVQET